MSFNPYQDGLFRDCSRIGGRGGGKKTPLPKICHTYPTMMKLGTVIPYLKKFQKLYESRDKPLEFCWHQHFLFCWHQHFFTRNLQILLYQEIQISIPFRYILSKSSNFFWVFKDCFNKRGSKFWWCQQKGPRQVFFKQRFFEKKLMTSSFLPMMSPTQFYLVIQIIK